MTTERTIPAPLINPETRAFYDAAAKDQLLIGKCKACGEHHYYPRRICPHCFSDATDWVPAAGTGTVYTYSTMHRGVPVPYTIAYVTLDEGVTMMTNLVDLGDSRPAIGQKVKVVFREAEGGTKVPLFAPA
jgi:uncharacterized OB-fold protein